MSIVYQLELRAPVSPDAVVSALVETGAGAIESHDGTKGTLRGGGWFDVDVAEHEPPHPVEAQFGFAPTIKGHFGLAKFGDFEAQETDVLRLALGVLARIPGDALLHFAHDEGVAVSPGREADRQREPVEAAATDSAALPPARTRIPGVRLGRPRRVIRSPRGAHEVSPDASATDRRCGVRIRRDRMLRVSTRDPVAGCAPFGTATSSLAWCAGSPNL